MDETVTLEIERMGYGAEGVAHLPSGKAVFVRGAVTGDVVEAEVTEEKKSFARARATRLIEPSPKRAKDWRKLAAAPSLQAIAPWAALSYPEQLSSKQANVESALTKNAHLGAATIQEVLHEIVPAPCEWGYRNKLELAAAPDAQGRITLGFHEAGTDEFVRAQACPLGNRLIEKSPKALTGALRYLAGSGDLGIYRVGVRASTRTNSVEVALWTPPSSFPRGFAAKVLRDAIGATSIVRVIADPGSSRKVKQLEVLDGEGIWREELAGFGFQASAPSFFQVNTEQAETLVKLALGAAAPDAAKTVADLYAGVGTFSLPLAATGAEVFAIELEGSSARDFRANAEANTSCADIVCDDVARALPDFGRVDCVVVDPPRAGLAEDVICELSAATPERIIYISCDPQTLARDIARFAPYGYKPSSVTPVDMFPQTYHVECVCVLSRTTAA